MFTANAAAMNKTTLSVAGIFPLAVSGHQASNVRLQARGACAASPCKPLLAAWKAATLAMTNEAFHPTTTSLI
jgi:hypothetical protein